MHWQSSYFLCNVRNKLGELLKVTAPAYKCFYVKHHPKNVLHLKHWKIIFRKKNIKTESPKETRSIRTNFAEQISMILHYQDLLSSDSVKLLW